MTLLILLLILLLGVEQPSVLSYVAQIITSVFAGIAAIIGAINIGKINRAERKIESVRKTGEATHELSNSAMGQQLLTNVELLAELSVQAHRFAAVTKEAADLATAQAFDVKVEAAKKLYETHVRKQAVVDATNTQSKCD